MSFTVPPIFYQLAGSMLGLASPSVPAADDPDQVTVYTTLRDLAGNPVPRYQLEFQLVDPDVTVDAHLRTIRKVSGDADGLVSVTLRRGAEYRVRVRNGEWVTFTTPTDAATYELEEAVLGPLGEG